MIVPRPSLIVLSAVTLVPLLGLGVSMASAAAPAIVVLALLVLVAVLDARAGVTRLREIQISLPARLRWFQNRPAQLEIAFETTTALAAKLRLGLGLPEEITAVKNDLHVLLPEKAGRYTYSFDCLPRRRGRFLIEGCFYELISPFGLWEIRGSGGRAVEVRIYPNLESERKHVAALFLRTSRVGLRALRQVGQGRDFEKLREYVPGDGYDTIHWKATARRGHPITKVFQVERTQEVYVVLDASRLSARLQDPADSSQGTHLDRYIAATLILGLAAEKQGDLFGLLTVSDRVLNFVRARNGKEHYNACREALYQLEPQPVSPDFDEIATFIRLRLRRRALIVFMTDLDDPVIMESFQRAVDLICRQHLVLVQVIATGALQPVFSNPDVAQVDDVYRDLAQHFAWHDLRQLSGSLQQHGVTLSLLEREQFSARTIANYLRVKERQLL